MSETKTTTGSNPPAAKADPYRVVVVDDSAIIRGLLTRTLQADPEIVIVDSVSNGQYAIDSVKKHDPDVMVLDIEMPVMDGLTALPKLIAADPSLKVIMASTLTLRNADISLKALELGAADYIPKPTSTGEIASGYDFKQELIAKVKALGAARRAIRPGKSTATVKRPGIATPPSAPGIYRGAAIKLRETPLAAITPAVVAIGCSTGGPQALFRLLPALGKDLRQPILITQHMPATFTTILAEHIQKLTGRPCAEAKEGEAVVGGKIYVAPGNFHMTVEGSGAQHVIRLNQNPPENFCRPAVDPMFRSLAQAYGRNVLAVVLTGMGQDGLKGGQVLVQAGGTLIAQDEATSVVWGMPGAVATGGLCSAVLPLDDIGPQVRKLAMRQAA